MTVSILVAVTHLLGAGHLTRAAALGRACARAGHRVTLVSGGRPAPLIDTAALDFVQLPPVSAGASDLRALLRPDGTAADATYLSDRRDLMVDALGRVRPDVVVTELFPFGRRALSSEFEALIEAAYALRPRPRIAASVRDILVAPDRPAKVAHTHALLARRYDAVLIHSDPGLAPLEASWPVDRSLAGRLIYTGYVDEEPASAPTRDEPRSPGAEGAEARWDVVVSGGSSEAGLLLYRAAVEAAALIPECRWLVLVGAGVPEQEADAIRAASRPNTTVTSALRGFRDLLRRAAVFVGQAGYNTAIDILASGVRSVLVPFERGDETEQRIRAERLAAAGLADVLPEAELSAPSLADAVRRALAAPAPPPNRIDRRGATRSATILADLAAGRATTAGLAP